MSPGLKTTFGVHAVVSLIFGLGMYLIPGWLTDLVKWTPYDPGMTQSFGAAMLAFSLSSWLSYKSGNFSDVKIIVHTEIVLTILGALGSLYQVLFAGGPAFNWVSFALFTLFAFLFSIHRKG